MAITEKQLIGKVLSKELKEFIYLRTSTDERENIEKICNRGKYTLTNIIAAKSNRKITKNNFPMIYKAIQLAIKNNTIERDRTEQYIKSLQL